MDLDVTDLPLHGHQEGRFFHGYYDSYCYLPLSIFCGDHLLCARLRTAGQDVAAGSKEEVERVVGQIRQAWPEVRITLRADSGFCRGELMKWCEEHDVQYVFGFARNERLRRMIETEMARAQVETIRLRLLKIGARIRITARKVWVSMASSYPLQAVFAQAWSQLRC